MLIDTHAHLFWDSFKEDFDQVIQNCIDSDVTTIINVGVDTHFSQVAAELETKKIKFYSTIGIHPHEAIKYDTASPEEAINTDIEILRRIYAENPKKVVAVGECGLDYFFESNPDFTPTKNLSIEKLKDLQRLLFKAQIELAKELNLPLTIHVRDDRSKNPKNIEAWDETLELIGDNPTILHCYSGLLSTTQKALLKENVLISFAANITYPKNEYLREAAKLLPLEKIVLETDSPFLAPQSNRGKRNEPSTVKEIAQLIAKLKDVSFEQVAEKTTENVKRIFKL